MIFSTIQPKQKETQFSKSHGIIRASQVQAIHGAGLKVKQLRYKYFPPFKREGAFSLLH
jgi:hypothetical protein